MDERQFNAIRSCEQSAATIARRYGWDAPHFYLPHGDSSIEFWRAAEALSVFLAKVEKADKASVKEVEAKEKTLLTVVSDDEREEKASEPTVYIDDKPVASFADVVGIGRANQASLYNAGYFTWEDILQAGIVKIREDVPTIGASRVRALFTRAQREAK